MSKISQLFSLNIPTSFEKHCQSGFQLFEGFIPLKILERLNAQIDCASFTDYSSGNDVHLRTELLPWLARCHKPSLTTLLLGV